MINNNDRFIIDEYDNKTIESVVKNLAEIVSKYILYHLVACVKCLKEN